MLLVDGREKRSEPITRGWRRHRHALLLRGGGP